MLYIFTYHKGEIEVIYARVYQHVYFKENGSDLNTVIVEMGDDIRRRKQTESRRRTVPHQKYLVSGKFIEDGKTSRSFLTTFCGLINELLDIDLSIG